MFFKKIYRIVTVNNSLNISALLASLVIVGCQQFSGDDNFNAESNSIDQKLTSEFLAVKSKAEGGDSYSQFRLGVMYAAGEGIERDASEAVEWYILAARNGVKEAQYNAGYAFLMGEGVPIDEAKAFRWYSKAAESGLSEAAFNLSLMYQQGKGVERDMEQSLLWAKKAAMAGDARAQHNLGSWYGGQDPGVTVDDEMAFKWYLMAAKQGIEASKYVVGSRYLYGAGVQKEPVLGYMWLMSIDRKTDLVQEAIKNAEDQMDAEALLMARRRIEQCESGILDSCL
jgi:TPR repeat protein